jgi:hypothetical protein
VENSYAARWVHNEENKLKVTEINSGNELNGLAQNRDKWRALVNMVINLLGFIKCWETIELLHNWLPFK